MSEESAVLDSIKDDLVFYKDTIKSVSEEVRNNEVSNYPVFVAHKSNLEIGRPILSNEEFSANWNVNISTLEEFVAKKLIFPGRVDAFRKVYKNPDNFICFFILEDDGANFAFVPY